MAKEVVITSVPRGIKLGRTGFQVVMRTAGTADGVLSTLEQLAGYRHVFPQGSGKNPLIYTYRQVRGPTGQLNVLGRTTDAGNDFSNRSNKLAHLLAIEPGELSALRNSSPAAVLAAIDGRLSQVWQGGPEERPQPFALPAPAAQAGVCKRWNDVKGDGGWGGLLAQRALRGQPSLIIAPDCSPTWSRRLLDLFQEVLALLPPDGRWKTTFETTVIGSSSSLLRGTYAGSPESAAGHAGLLVVDLSQRGPLPANVALDEMIAIARQGPKQAAAGRAPPLSGMGNAPMLPGTAIEGAAVTAGGLRPAGPVGPSRAPVASFDDDETPRSQVGWYIGLATVLLGAVLVGGSVGVWFWLDGRTTQELQIRFNAYADIADEKMPSREQGVDAPPGLQNWKRLFRDDKDSSNVSDAAFPILLSALRTKRVDATTIQDRERRRELVAAANALADIKGDRAKLLDHASVLGLTIPENLDANKKNAVTTFLASWLYQDGDKPGAATPLDDFAGLNTKINLAGRFIEAVFATAGDPGREKQLEALVKDIWPNALKNDEPNNWLASFAQKLDPAKTDFTKVSDMLSEATKPKTPEPPPPPRTTDQITKDNAHLAQQAFTTFCDVLKGYKPREPNALKEKIILAEGFDAAHLRFDVELPACGAWKPRAEPVNPAERTVWRLTGLPGKPDEPWGTLTLNEKQSTLVLERPTQTDATCLDDVLYVPIIFSSPADKSLRRELIPAAPQTLHVQSDPPSASLYHILSGGTVALIPNPPCVISASLTTDPNVFQMTLNTGSHSNRIKLETRAQHFSRENKAPVVDVQFHGKEWVWLDSLACKLDGNAAEHSKILVSFLKPGTTPWTDRGTRFGNLQLTFSPPSGKPWNENAFPPLLLEILKDEGVNVTIAEIKSDLTAKKIADYAGEKPSLDDWTRAIVNRLSGRGCPYREFVRKHFEKDHKERPADPEEFSEKLGEKPSKEQQEKYKRDQEAYHKHASEIRAAQTTWDEGLRKRLSSRFMLLRFLDSLGDADRSPKGVLDDRSLALAVLGIEAWSSLRDQKDTVVNDARNLEIASFFSAKLDLVWTIGDRSITVPRLRVNPGK